MERSLLLSTALFSLLSFASAQNWVNGGNNLKATGRIGTLSNQSLTFITHNAERGRFTTGGNFGIGTSSPVGKFHVNGFGSFGNKVTSSNATRALNLVDNNAVMRVLRVDASKAPAVELISRKSADGANVAYWDFYAEPGDASFRIRDRQSGGSGLDRITITHSNGSVGIGTSTPSGKLDVVGSTSSGTGINTSGYNSGLNSIATSSTGYGVHGTSDYIGVYGSAHYIGAYGIGTSYGTYGHSEAGTAGVGGSTNSGTAGVYGTGYNGYGVYGSSEKSFGGYFSGSAGVWGTGDDGIGVYGTSDGGDGVQGSTNSGTAGVYGSSENTYGGYFTSTNSTALVAKSGATWAGIFYGSVYCSNGFVTSDKNLKTNIRDFGNAMSIINKLKPQNYEFKKDAKYSSLRLPEGMHYGLLAQDIEQVLPNLVFESPHKLKTDKPVMKPIKPTADGKPLPPPAVTETKDTIETIKIKAVNYAELIPIMVKAMQEQDNKIQEQDNKIQEQDNNMQELKTEKDKEIADLKSEINDLKSLILKNSNSSATTSLNGYLKQNTPNPSNNNTVISYYTPGNTRKARILVTDIKGSVLKAYTISRGEGQVSISNGELPAGTYNYTLYVNSSKVDTKQMVVVK